MIPTAAISEYLNRRVDDFRYLKQAGARELDQVIADLKADPHPSLRLHQKACFALGVSYPHFAFWLDMGVGKSLLALELLRYWWQVGRMRRAVVFVTSDKAFPTWKKQMERFETGLPYVMLQGSSEEKRQQLRDFGEGLVFVPYPGAVRMLCRLERRKKRNSEEEQNVLEFDDELFAEFSDRVDGFVMDESTRASGYSSLTHRLCLRLRKQAVFCYALAGRPFGRDPTLLWAQHYIVDQGQTLGPTLGLFRAAFFFEKENRWAKSAYAKKYVFNKRMLPDLMRMVQHRSINYSAEECIDVPKFNTLLEAVTLPQEAGTYYRRVVGQIIAARGNLQEMRNAFMRMRQLSSGFLGFRDEDDDGKRVEVAFDENPKLELLLDLLQSLPDDRKAVVFYEFTFSGRKIVESLRELRERPIWLWSGTKDTPGELDRFMKSPDCRIAVINNRVGAYSLDGLQEVANYTFFYESPVSSIDRDQAEHRLRRDGQRFKVFQYDLVVEGTMDRNILAYHREGDDLLRALRKNPNRFFSNGVEAVSDGKQEAPRPSRRVEKAAASAIA